jgi:MarR family transcriptional regulator, temperature-dependent positive regulator of motility
MERAATGQGGGVAGRSEGRKVPRRSALRAQRKAAPAIEPEGSVRVKIDFGPLDRYLGYYLRRLYDDYRKHFVSKAGDLDVQPREVGALFVIGLNPGLTPTQLCGALELDGAQITAMLNMFENRGLVERRVSSTDGRSRRAYLTPGGQSMLKRVHKFVDGFDRSFSGASLTDKELAQLIGLLAKLHSGAKFD